MKLSEWTTVWHEIFAGVYFCGLAIFVFCGNLFLGLGQIVFSCCELIFAIFFLVHATVIHIFKQYYGVHTPYYVKQVFKLYTALFLNEKDKLQLNRHSGVNFVGGQN